MNDSKRHINKDIQKVLEQEQAFKGTVFEGQKRRFTVINQRDVERYVPVQMQDEFWTAFNKMAEIIEKSREKEGKKPYNVYITINLDEPYVGEVIEIMKRHGH